MTDDNLRRHGRMLGLIRALETGALPTPVTDGGYGRNTAWVRMSLASVLEPIDDSYLERCVRADVVLFRTVGEGFTVDEADLPARIALIGPSGRPSSPMNLVMDGSLLRALPSGDLYLLGQVGTFKPDGRAWPVG